MNQILTVAHMLPDHNPFPPSYPAGTELRVEQVARRQRRYRPVVICRAFDNQPLEERYGAMLVRRIRIGRVYQRLFQKLTRLDPLPYAMRMWSVALEERAALIHIHNEPKLLARLRGRLQKASCPVVVHVANEKPLPAGAGELVTHWVACSKYMASWLINDNQISPERVSVIYTGVNASATRPIWECDVDVRAALRRRFGVSDPDSVVLVFAGRLVKEKGVNELLDAFRLLQERHGRNVHLLIAGNVRDSDDPRNEKAVYGRAVAARMNKMVGVRWVGSLHPAEMHDFLLAGDIFVLPSLWSDPFPTVMVEAAAAGLPIVAAARGGISEFLEGCPAFEFVQDPADPLQLAESIDRHVTGKEGRLQAGRWLRDKVERNFDWLRVCEDFENLYAQLLEGRRGVDS